MRSLTLIAAALTSATALAVPLAGSAGAAPAAPSPARAMAAPEDCYSGDVCAWEHSNYLGNFIRGGSQVGNVGNHMNDRTTSIWNRSDRRVCFYEHTQSRGAVLVSLAAGGWRANVGATANDKISSWGHC